MVVNWFSVTVFASGKPVRDHDLVTAIALMGEAECVWKQGWDLGNRPSVTLCPLSEHTWRHN